MEFNELKKIWDQQNNKPMYIINESAMQQIIHRKGKKINHYATINEWGLMGIMTFTGSFVLIESLLDRAGFLAYVLAITCFLIVGFIWKIRQQRLNRVQRFDQSVLGELDEAISNSDYLVNLSSRFGWWFLLPLGAAIIMNMAFNDAALWKWIVIPLSFVLAFSLVRFELNRVHLPRKRRLEKLRAKLTQEVETE